MVTRIWQVINFFLLVAIGVALFRGKIEHAQWVFVIFAVSLVCYLFFSPDTPLYSTETWQDLHRGSIAYNYLALGQVDMAKDMWPFTWEMDPSEKNAAQNALHLAHAAFLRKGA